MTRMRMILMMMMIEIDIFCDLWSDILWLSQCVVFQKKEFLCD